jgi:hypothetical protein
LVLNRCGLCTDQLDKTVDTEYTGLTQLNHLKESKFLLDKKYRILLQLMNTSPLNRCYNSKILLKNTALLHKYYMMRKSLKNNSPLDNCYMKHFHFRNTVLPNILDKPNVYYSKSILQHMYYSSMLLL